MPCGRLYPAAAGGRETAPLRQRGVGAPPELEPSPPPAALTTFRAAPRQRQPQAQGQAERRPGQHRARREGARSASARGSLARGLQGAPPRRPDPTPPPGGPVPEAPPPVHTHPAC